MPYKRSVLQRRKGKRSRAAEHLPDSGISQAPLAALFGGAEWAGPGVAAGQVLQMQRDHGNQGVQRILRRMHTQRQPVDTDLTTLPALELPEAVVQYTTLLRSGTPPLITQSDAELIMQPAITRLLESIRILDSDKESVKKAKQAALPRVARQIQELIHNQIVEPQVKPHMNGLPGVVISAIERGPGSTSLEKQINFLTALAPWFPQKSISAVTDHFKNCIPIDLPGYGSEHMHRDAVERLRLVARKMNELGMPMPSPNNALSLRGRFNPNDQEKSLGMMSHTLGWAIDYRAANMPHIHNKSSEKHPDGDEVTELRDIIAGPQAGYFSFAQTNAKLGSVGFRSTMGLMSEVGKQIATTGKLDPKLAAVAASFLREFDSNFAEAVAGSKLFSESGLAPQLSPMRTKHFAQKKELEKARQRLTAVARTLKPLKDQVARQQALKPKQQEQFEALQQEEASLTARIAALPQEIEAHLRESKAKFPTIFGPWLTKIQAVKADLEKQRTTMETALKPFTEQLKLAQAARQNQAKSFPSTGAKLDFATQESLTQKELAAELKKADQRRGAATLDQPLTALRMLAQAPTIQQKLAAELALVQQLKQADPTQRALLVAQLAQARQERQAAALAAGGLGSKPLRQANELSARQLTSAAQAITRQVQSAEAKLKRLLPALDLTNTAQVQQQQASLEQQASSLEGFRALVTAELQALNQLQAAQQQHAKTLPAVVARIERITKLTNRLQNDEQFVLGIHDPNDVADDPFVEQLTRRGFFSPDAEPAGRQSLDTEAFLTHVGLTPAATAPANQPGGPATTPQPTAPAGTAPQTGTPAQPAGQSGPAITPAVAPVTDAEMDGFAKARGGEGFNLTFMRLMHLYGFYQGTNWGGSQDSMHFDMWEGLWRHSTP